MICYDFWQINGKTFYVIGSKSIIDLSTFIELTETFNIEDPLTHVLWTIGD